MKIEGTNIFEIKGLWRMENQRGIFFRDINGDFEKFSLCLKLKFQQSGNAKYETEIVNDKSIFPEPNSLEREINRYFSFERRSHPPEEIDKFFEVIQVDRDPISIEAENFIPSIEWEREELEKWRKIYAADFSELPNFSNRICRVDLHSDSPTITSDEYPSLRDLLEELKKVKSTPFIPKVSLNFHFFTPIIDVEKSETLTNEYLQKYAATYCSMPFTIAEKYMSIKTLMLFAYYGGSKLRTVISPELDIITQTFKTGYLTNCDFEDMQEIVSYAYIPNSFFDECARMTTARNLFNEHYRGTKQFIDHSTGEMIDTVLNHNFQLLQFLFTANKLFSFGDIKTIWANFVIPYQIAFRSETAVVVNPIYVTKIGLA